MFNISRDKIGKVAAEVADHLQLVENVKALQTAQKELADSIERVSERVRDLQADMRALKAETLLDCVKETQSIVNSVQGDLNSRIESLAIKHAVMESSFSTMSIGERRSTYALPPSNKNSEL